jgi:hypothetical protein
LRSRWLFFGRFCSRWFCCLFCRLLLSRSLIRCGVGRGGLCLFALFGGRLGRFLSWLFLSWLFLSWLFLSWLFLSRLWSSLVGWLLCFRF